jgi:arylsulfatase A-like enzyme
MAADTKGSWNTALLLAALCAGCKEARPAPLGTIEVERVVRDFLAEPGSWQVVRARSDAAPRVEILCPSQSTKIDGVDMPSLLVPPSGEVRLLLGAGGTEAEAKAAGSNPVRLVTRVGVDQLDFGKLSEQHPEVNVAFELRAGERVLAREVLELQYGQHRTNAWADLGGPRGVELRGLSEVSLRTETLLSDGFPIELTFPLHAGFGGLRLVRSLPRPRKPSSPEEPNVVLVLMDTLRADHLSTYGYARPTSPRLSALAQRGVRFDACYSTASWTWPATASILTGLTTMEHGLTGARSSYLFEQSETLAESLQLAGFTTAAWSANPIVSPRRNFDQGFESFHAAEAGEFEKAGEFFEDVRAFLRRERGTRFFLYLHLAEPHTPHHPLPEADRLLAADVPPDFRAQCDDFWRATGRGPRPRGGAEKLGSFAPADVQKWATQLYDASVWSGDHWLGELLDELAALGLDDETVVAFTGDHGEELFERGFLGHGHSLKQELVRVPLVVAGPGVPVAQRNTGLFSVRLLAPLLARLAGVTFGDGDEALRALTQPERGADFVLFTTTRGSWKGRDNVPLVGLTDGRWKLNLALDGGPAGSSAPAPEGALELFQLEHDPRELEDLSASRPEEAARLRAILLERLSALEARRIGTDVPAGEATLEMLEHLGYGGDDER